MQQWQNRRIDTGTPWISKNILSPRASCGGQETPIPRLTFVSIRAESPCERTWDTEHGDKAVASCQWSVRKVRSD
jgi:hypothetical protein